MSKFPLYSQSKNHRVDEWKKLIDKPSKPEGSDKLYFQDGQLIPLAVYGILTEQDSCIANHSIINSTSTGNSICTLVLDDNPPVAACFSRCFNKVILRIVFENASATEDYHYAGVTWTASLSCSVKVQVPGTVLGTLNFQLQADKPQQVAEFDITQYFSSKCGGGNAGAQVSVEKISYVVSGPGTAIGDVKLRAYIVKDVQISEDPNKAYHIFPQPLTLGGNPLTFNWALRLNESGSTPCDNKYKFPNYQFQLLKLEHEYLLDTALSNNEQQVKARIDWSRALTIETYSSNPFLTLTIPEGRGFYAWRVRGIGNKYPKGIAHSDNWGEWSYGALPEQHTIHLERVISGDTTAFYNTVTINNLTNASGQNVSNAHNLYRFGLFFYRGLENDRNWIYSRNFTEGTDAKGPQISEKMVFANGINQITQEQAKMASKDSLLISVTGYDFVGRSVLKSLAAPKYGSGFSFDKNALLNSGSLPYSAFDFDPTTPSGSLVPQTATGTISTYYSTSSPVSTVASAQGYPFTRTVLEASPLSRTIEASGVGTHHKIGQKTVKTEYLPTTEDELVSVLGDEAPKASQVSKIKTTDENGVVSIKYQLAEGKIIASCLLYSQPSDFTPLTEYPASSDGERKNSVTVEDTARGIKPIGNNAYVSTTEFYISKPSTVCTLKYALTRKKVETACPELCKVCDYQISLRLFKRNTDGSLQTIASRGTYNLTTNGETDCTSGQLTFTPLSGSPWVATLSPGTYIIERTIFTNNTDPSLPSRKLIDKYISDQTQVIDNEIYGPNKFLQKYFGPTIHDYVNKTTVYTNPDNKTRFFGELLAKYVKNRNDHFLLENDYVADILNNCYQVPLPQVSCTTGCVPNSNNEYSFAWYFNHKYPAKVFAGAFPVTNLQYNNTLSSPPAPQPPFVEVNTTTPIVSFYDPNPGNAIFDLMITDMINVDGYNCYDLWNCWRSAVEMYEKIIDMNANPPQPKEGSIAPIVGNDPNLLELFLDCAGRKICGRAPTMADYVSHPYKYLPPDDGGVYSSMYTSVYNRLWPPGGTIPILDCNVDPQQAQKNNELIRYHMKSISQFMLKNHFASVTDGSDDIRKNLTKKGPKCCDETDPSYDEVCCKEEMEKETRNLCETTCDTQVNRFEKENLDVLLGIGGYYIKGKTYTLPAPYNVTVKVEKEEDLPIELRPKYMDSIDRHCLVQLVRDYCYSHCDPNYTNYAERYTKVITRTLDFKLPISLSGGGQECSPGYELLSVGQTKARQVISLLNAELRKVRENMKDDGPYDWVINYKLREIKEKFPEVQIFCQHDSLNPLDKPYMVTVFKNLVSEFFEYPSTDPNVCRIGYRNSKKNGIYSDRNKKGTWWALENTPGDFMSDMGFLDWNNQKSNLFPKESWKQFDMLFWMNYYPTRYFNSCIGKYTKAIKDFRIINGGAFYHYVFPILNSYDSPAFGQFPMTPFDSCFSSTPLQNYKKIQCDYPQKNIAYLKWANPLNYHLSDIPMANVPFLDTIYSPGMWQHDATIAKIECLNGVSTITPGINQDPRPIRYTDIFSMGWVLDGVFAEVYNPLQHLEMGYNGGQTTWDFRKWFPRGRVKVKIKNPFPPYQEDNLEFSLEPDVCSNGTISETINIHIKINNTDRVYPIQLHSKEFNDLVQYLPMYDPDAWISNVTSYTCRNTDPTYTGTPGYYTQMDNFFRYFGYFEVNEDGYLVFNDAQGGKDNDSIPDYVFNYLRFNCFDPNCEVDTVAILCMPCGQSANCKTGICVKWNDPPVYEANLKFRAKGCEEYEVERLIAYFKETIYKQHKVYMDTLQVRYNRTCGNPKAIADAFTAKYSEDYIHYTLYYYDRAGRLVKTIPPKGVIPQTSLPYLRVPMSHTFITSYEYNTVGELLKQTTPDGGATSFVYDSKGRLRFSRNAKQSSSNRYSYTKYDNLSRVIEVGEMGGSLPGLTQADDATYPTSTASYYTKTFYTTPATLPSPYNTLTQTHLLNRISYTETKQPSIGFSGSALVNSYYSYDPHGNVQWLIQEIPGLGASKTDYEYDLVSGKVTEVKYRDGYTDRMYHRYEYDADNRITSVSTSRDGKIWEKDARYLYYAHGPLRRTEIGEDQIQGLDYTYTVHGWLKAVNHPYLDGSNVPDPGKDGTTGAHTNVAKDVFGTLLSYYVGDYISANTNLSTHASSKPLDAQPSPKNLYNGNIAAWTTGHRLSDGTTPSAVTAGIYNYDVLNRLRSNTTYEFNGTTWTDKVDKWKNIYDYDPNGNIKTLERYNGIASPGRFDQLTYIYPTGNNKLDYITDGIGDLAFSYDIDNQVANNYKYDAIGNMTSDAKGGVSTIEWTPSGKVSQVIKIGNTETIKFIYDAMGNRVAKRHQNGATIKNTWYVRDAQGNVMGTYEADGTNSPLLTEAPIYSSERIGMISPPTGVARTAITEPSIYDRVLYNKLYEYKDHLGNVRVVTKDVKLRTTTGIPFKTSVLSYSNYYPFGMQYPDIDASTTQNATYQSAEYRYGYNGKEKDGELKGEGNSYDYGARIYDPRIGRWMSTDRFEGDFPSVSTYSYADNNTISKVDIGGDWPWIANNAVFYGDITPHGIVTHYSLIDQNSFGSKHIHKQLCSFYKVWNDPNNYHYAPAVAAHLKNNSIPVVIGDITNDDEKEKGDTKGLSFDTDLIVLDRSIFKSPTAKDHAEGVFFHELIHDMGFGEFDAFSAEYAAGYIDEKDVENYLRRSPIMGPWYQAGWNASSRFYFTKGGDELLSDIFFLNDPEREFKPGKGVKDVLKVMKERGEAIIQGKATPPKKEKETEKENATTQQ